MLHRVVLAVVSTCLLALTFGISPLSNAQAQTSAASRGNCPYWIDSATGDRVATITIPTTTGVTDYRNYRASTDQHHISSTERGKTFVRQSDGSWADAATGEQVPTITIPITTGVTDYRNYRASTDQNHISSTERGKTFVLIPCPPSSSKKTVTKKTTTKKIERKKKDNTPPQIGGGRGGPGNGGD